MAHNLVLFQGTEDLTLKKKVLMGSEEEEAEKDSAENTSLAEMVPGVGPEHKVAATCPQTKRMGGRGSRGGVGGG